MDAERHRTPSGTAFLMDIIFNVERSRGPLVARAWSRGLYPGQFLVWLVRYERKSSMQVRLTVWWDAPVPEDDAMEEVERLFVGKREYQIWMEGDEHRARRKWFSAQAEILGTIVVRTGRRSRYEYWVLVGNANLVETVRKDWTHRRNDQMYGDREYRAKGQVEFLRNWNMCQDVFKTERIRGECSIQYLIRRPFGPGLPVLEPPVPDCFTNDMKSLVVCRP